MSTVDTSSWNPDADLNTAIEGIPLNSNAGIAQTWKVIAILMAGLKGDTDTLETNIEGKADDAAVVHLAGAETVTGTKTFAQTVKISANEETGVHVQRTDADITASPSSSKTTSIVRAKDPNGEDVAYLSHLARTNGTGDLYLVGKGTGKTTSGLMIRSTSSGPSIIPYEDLVTSLGGSSKKWKELWAVNGTIQTSDERLKLQIADVPDDVLDAWGDVSFRQFKMTNAVELKGEEARLHNGVVAQEIESAFKAHGLDISRYGLFCFDLVDENGEELSAYSIRYGEALCMEAAFQRRRADRLEARIKALEEKLNG